MHLWLGESAGREWTSRHAVRMEGIKVNDDGIATTHILCQDSTEVQSGAATCSDGFRKCFLRVPQADGLYCSCHAAQARKENFQNLWNKLPPKAVHFKIKPNGEFCGTSCAK